ncbi:hypothetical protein [Streptomyces niveus]|uniref:hypothetical protein n=1 Tax=Streptomyces niveus TaxID=193462 RepID=UPI00344A43D1
MARRERREREPIDHLPGVAEIRIAADVATLALITDVLGHEFRLTKPRTYESSGYSYFRLDTGNTSPDPDDE